MQESSSYRSLIEKLDKFIRKYYTNQLIRGAIFSAVYVLAFFLAINLLEYYLYLPPLWRKVLFFGFLFSSAIFTATYFVSPLLHYYRLGKIISYEQAARIIGTHFAEVKDKLLNILQLRHNAEAQPHAELLLAAIDQKAMELKPVDFSFAVDLTKNKKYLKFLVPPLLVFLFILIAAPHVISEGTKRLYHNDTFFEKKAPFKFLVQNAELKALQSENFTLEVKTDGEALPAEMFVETDKAIVRMKKNEANRFTFDFVNLQESFAFRLSANGFYSQPYMLDVVSKPVVTGFEITCDYPAYTGKPDKLLKNTGDLMVPAGTKLSWRFNTEHAEAVTMLLGDSAYSLKRNGPSEFLYSKTFLQSASYTVLVSNKQVKQAEPVNYSLNVTPDLYPVITVNEKNDSALQKYYYYVGEISDDYGLQRLTFNYQITRNDSTASAMKSLEVPFARGRAARFTYYWSLSDFQMKPGDRISYYFEVWDNDGVHGSKSARSEMMNFSMPTLNELNKELAQESKELKQEMKDAMKKAKEVKNDLQQMKDKLLDKQNLNWEDKKNLTDNMEMQKQLQQQLEEIKNKLEQNFEKQNEFKDLNPQIAEKQKALQELFNQVMSQEMKELYEKLQKMLEELQKRDAIEKMDDMQAGAEKVEKELDRMLELFKKLEMNQKLQETADKLEQLANKQEELANRTEKNQDGKNQNEVKDQKAQEQLKEEQQKLNEELKEAKKDLEDLKKLNEESKSGQDFKEAEQSMDNAGKQQQDAQQSMNSKQNAKASGNQKNAANNMKNASKKLSDMKQQMEQEQEAEDMQAIRQLLENILRLSFDQEKLMAQVKQTSVNTPRYVELMKEQQRIRANSKMVEDSLYAVARRQEAIKSFVTKETNNVNKNLARSIDDMQDRIIPRALSNQQFVMTGYNNLALMLSEALQQMQQQSQSNSPSDGKPKMCMKGKKAGNGLPNLSKMQKQLNDKISQMAEMMKREGQGQKAGQGVMSKEFAEMAQMQAQIRRELEKINQAENKDGQNALGDLGKTARQMEETEKSLVNKQLTTEMLRRQQDIMTRLLEAENAQRERDEKQERESHTARPTDRRLPPSLEEYLKAKRSEVEFYKTVPPELVPYYRSLAEKYFRNITEPVQ